MPLPEIYDKPLERLKPLPGTLKKNMEQIRSLDIKTMMDLNVLNDISKDYLDNLEFLNPKERTERLNQIEKLFERAELYSVDKVAIAEETYETVDKFIRQLDEDLLELKPSFIEEQNNGKTKEKGKKDTPKKMKRKSSKFSDESSFNPCKKSARKKEEDSCEESEKDFRMGISNMPVDPNEPIFCICRQVSYGSMIKCDDSDCVFEWFHFSCVNISVIPKGKWYCPKCKPMHKK